MKVASRLQIKADNALRTIGEAAEVLEIPTHVIRFWETKFSNLKPVKYNGRRYYSAENLIILKKIKELLYEQDHNIKEVILYFKQRIVASKTNYVHNPLTSVKDRLIQAKNRLNAILQK